VTGTLNVHVTGNGTAKQYMQVKAWNLDFQVFGAETNASGDVSLTVPAGVYKVWTESNRDNVWLPQWAGKNGAGVATMDQAGEFTVADSGTTAVTFLLSDAVQLYGDATAVGMPFLWWKDTTANAVIRLLPGEERRPFAGDRQDPLYKHVLAGPFTSYDDAAAL
jgi:hypothetical protein